MEHRLGSKAVGPPPLIITTLWTSSGYSWAKKVQNDTLGATKAEGFVKIFKLDERRVA